MFRMYASNPHSYTHLIIALGIVRKLTMWGFITSQYPGIHAIGLPSVTQASARTLCPAPIPTWANTWHDICSAP